jgi:hypothetical protein
VREIRLHGSEGGGTELNRSSLPLSGFHRSGHMSLASFGCGYCKAFRIVGPGGVKKKNKN